MYQRLVNKPQQDPQVQTGTDLFARYDLELDTHRVILTYL